MDRIRAPYVFVPAAPEVVFDPSLGDGHGSGTLPDLHDAPCAPTNSDPGGISGTFTLRVTARTPLFVRGTRAQRGRPGEPDRFARVPSGANDGKFCIPGSSLRGMLRQVVEIASHAKMARVNDRRYGVRDLHNRPLYLDHMAALLTNRSTGRNEPMPLVSAGWLKRTGEWGDDDSDPGTVVATITPCHFAKVDYAMLCASRYGPRGYQPGRKQGAGEKYQAFGLEDYLDDQRHLRVQFNRTVLSPHRAPFGSGALRLGDYGKVTSLGEGLDLTGTLVLTGQPAEWRPGFQARPGAGQAKHHDFVFYGTIDGEAPLPVDAHTFRGFEQVHADTGQQHRSEIEPNAEWRFFRGAFAAGDRVPVFFLTERKGNTRVVRALGLAMMFRLAYRYSVGEVLEHTQPDALDPRFDLAEAVFGRVPLAPEARRDGKNHERHTLKGRVSIGLATCRDAPKPQELKEVIVVLGAPKASYYPNYVAQQADARTGRLVGDYRTFQDDQAILAGYKRYRPQDAQARPPLPARSNLDRTASAFVPLAPGAVFTAPVRVHNLRLWELGALLWSIDFGGRRDLYHGLGLAKPLGYGRVSLDIADVRLCPLTEWPDDPLADVPERPGLVAEAVQAFEAYMVAQRPQWRQSPSVQELFAAATPLPPGSSDGRSMTLDHPTERNEFTAAKRDRLVLAAASGLPRTTWSAVPKLAASRAAGAATGGAGAAAKAVAGTPAAVAAAGAAVGSAHRPSQPVVPPQPAASVTPAVTLADYQKAIAGLHVGNASGLLRQHAPLFAKLGEPDRRAAAKAVVEAIGSHGKRWIDEPWWKAIWMARPK